MQDIITTKERGQQLERMQALQLRIVAEISKARSRRFRGSCQRPQPLQSGQQISDNYSGSETRFKSRFLDWRCSHSADCCHTYLLHSVLWIQSLWQWSLRERERHTLSPVNHFSIICDIWNKAREFCCHGIPQEPAGPVFDNNLAAVGPKKPIYNQAGVSS